MSLRRFLSHPSWRGVRRGVVCALVAWALARTSLLQGLEEWLHDACFLWRGARASTAKIVVIGVDEQSADDLKKPLAYISPELAKVVTYAKGQGAAAIGIDLFVPESMQALPEFTDDGPGAAAPLGQAIADAGNVVLPEWYLHSENRWLKPLLQWRLKSINNPELTDLGFVNLDEDDDQFVRRQQLLSRRGSGEEEPDAPVPHFALALFARAQGHKIQWDEMSGTIIVGDLNIPLQDKKLLRINFAGPPGTYKPIPFSQVRAAAEKGQPMPELRGAIVLIGVTAPSQQDYHSTPYANRYARYLPGPDGGLMSGTEIHAHILATLLDRAFITTPIGFAGLPWLVVVGGLLGYVFSRLSLEWGLLIAVVHHFAWKGIALAGFTYFNWRIEMVGMLALGMLIYSVTFAFRWRELRRMFGVVKSAAVVRALEADPSRLDPGGEEREATVLFADIRGFTRFSEGRPPREVVALLNAYFSAVIPVVEAEGGTIDKFIGDGLMVLFGVPISLADHAPRGVRAGVAMVRRVHELQETWTRLGFEHMRIGVGVHTGSVVAGAIGTRHRIDYTAIGDTVNTASRIESENSKQGTEMLISATVLAALSEQDRQRLGRLGESRQVTVKNRTEPLVVYPVEFS